MQVAGHGTHLEAPLIIARSAEMQRVLDLASRAAGSDATVLIHGETGTGKELIARTIHQKSPRRDGPFVAVNCGAYTDSLLASELFGHVRGAFTGAVTERPGVFEAAAGGTVFLDEIAAMSPTMQIKVLRVLQERVVTRVGSSNQIPINARVVAATNADLADAVRTGAFREDLYYRVKVISFRLPPLRERRDDIMPLVNHFLELFCNAGGKHDVVLSGETVHVLVEHSWPGNVRQLRGEIEQLVALADDNSVVQLHQLSDEMRTRRANAHGVPDTTATPSAPRPPADSTGSDATYQELLDEWTRRVIADRLDRCNGNITKTAQSLAVSRSTLYALLKKYSMQGRED